MNDAELRALVREAVARHLGSSTPVPAAAALAPMPSRASHAAVHPSHAIYLTVVNSSDACVIEPTVPCDHCGYCKSHGH